jgi:hypothetical protein
MVKPLYKGLLPDIIKVFKEVAHNLADLKLRGDRNDTYIGNE